MLNLESWLCDRTTYGDSDLRSNTGRLDCPLQRINKCTLLLGSKCNWSGEANVKWQGCTKIADQKGADPSLCTYE